jgi:pilus assembly protein CpaB
LERNSAGEPQTAPVITLLVTLDDAEKLTLATTEGHIQLALRNPLDTRQETVNPVSSGALYRNGAPAPAAPAPKSRSVAKRAVAPPALPSVYSVEVIKGDKKDVTNF